MPQQVINGVGRVRVRKAASSQASSYDTDAQAFITAAALTDTTQKNAINDLVLDLKGAGIWTKMKALYPMVGGTATTHKFNLKDPRDLDAAYRLVFNGGWTHSSTGALPNGSNAYGNTFLTPSTALSLNSTHISFYSRTDNSGSWDMGSYVSAPSPSRLQILCKQINTTYYGVNSTSESSVANTNGTGLYIANRTSSSIHKLIKNNTINSNNVSSVGLPTRTVFIGGGNLDGGNLYGSKQCAFASIGDGLTDLESNLFYQIVEKFQYALGRNVNANQTFYFNRNYSNETNAFIFNGAISDATQISAVNTLVTTLKTAGIWTKMKAVYPMVGGTATAHKFNLVNPVDAASAYALTFAGGWTHSSTGALPNGTTAYANTSLVPSTALTLNNAHISYYSRTSTLGSGNKIDMGSFYSNDLPQYSYNIFQCNGRGSDNNTVGYISMNDPGLRYTQTNAAKFITTTRIADNSIKIIENGVVKSTNTTVQTSVYQGLPQISVYLGAINYRDSATPQGALGYSQKECAFASIGDGLTDAEATTFYNAVQAFQTTLGRQV